MPSVCNLRHPLRLRHPLFRDPNRRENSHRSPCRPIHTWLWTMYSQSHLGWHFWKLKAQSSNVSFATFQWKETFELWALSFETAFENVTPSGIGSERWGVEYHFQEISWALRPVVNGTQRRGVGLIKWYSTPSPNLSPYIFLGLNPSPPPLIGSTILWSMCPCRPVHTYTRAWWIRIQS